MKNHCIIPEKAAAVCDVCLNYVQDTLMIEPSHKKLKAENDCKTFLENLKNDKFEENELVEIVAAIGEKISSNIYEDSMVVSSSYKSINFDDDVKVKKYIKNRNRILT